MNDLDKETIEKMILELQKALKKLEDKKSEKTKKENKEPLVKSSGTTGRVIGTFTKINNVDVDFGIKFSEGYDNTINLKFNELLLDDSQLDLLKGVIELEVSKNEILNKYTLEIE